MAWCARGDQPRSTGGGPGANSGRRAWGLAPATSTGHLILCRPDGDRADADNASPSPLASVRGAIVWLPRRKGRDTRTRHPPVYLQHTWPETGPCRISSLVGPATLRASWLLCWPIRCQSELNRLPAMPNATPVSVVAFEFTGAICTAHEQLCGGAAAYDQR